MIATITPAPTSNTKPMQMAPGVEPAPTRARVRGRDVHPDAGQPRVMLHRHGGRIGVCSRRLNASTREDHLVGVCNAQLTRTMKFVGRTSRLHAYSWTSPRGAASIDEADTDPECHEKQVSKS